MTAADDNGFVADLLASLSSDKVVDEIVPEHVKKVNDEMYIAGQIDSTFVKNIKDLGLKTLFNIRDASEEGFQDFPADLPEGVKAINCPVDFSTESSIDKLLTQLDGCAKPFLVYCKTGGRAAAIGVAHTTTRSRFHEGQLKYDTELSEDQKKLLSKVCEGTPESECKMRTFVQEYISKKISNAVSRPGYSEVKEGLFISGQLSEEELKHMKEVNKVKAVLCLRPMSEAGEFGIGVLPREEEIVKGLGMQWGYIPVAKVGPYSAELAAQVLEMVNSMPRPLLIHCRSGKRVQNILQQAGGL